MATGSHSNRYTQIIERMFQRDYSPEVTQISFTRDEIIKVAAELNVSLPKNLGDVIYSFRYRAALPESIRQTAPSGQMWIIRPQGRSQYAFVLVPEQLLVPNAMLAETKVPDATPGIVALYAGVDEQALLTKLRYNRLIDIFTGVVCYSLQNHLRTTVPGVGQVETDELYVGIDRRGEQYIFPVQAKGGNDRLGIVQIEQDIALCKHRFPALTCRPIAAQSIADEVIALFELEIADTGIVIASEKHYRLVAPENIYPDDLETYRNRSIE